MHLVEVLIDLESDLQISKAQWQEITPQDDDAARGD
jgi:hypothetical protein